MNGFLRYALSLTLALTSLAGAVQLSDLSPDITRTQADANLTKDYAYRVLSDLSVRRIWNLDENRKLTMDFDPRTDKLICIVVDYKKPVSSKEGTDDVLAIAHADKANWNKLTPDKAEKYGVRNAKAMKIDKSYIFMESNSAGKCIRVSVFSSIPKESRVHMSDVSTVDIGKTAMGSNNSGSAGKTLMQDEERRLNTANKTDLAQNDTKPAKDEDSVTSHLRSGGSETTADDSTEETTAATTVATTEKPKKTAKKIDSTRKGDRGKDMDNLMAKLGLDGLEPIHYIIGVVVLILFFTIMSVMRRQAEAKRLAAQAALLRNGTPGLRPTARRR